ncbi:hypothetical protein VE02_05679 [Pseudogymnoascus sp. 03VT05]|nr:hypothetical protein VE02_05679 [Pseudogymnoascus sp. 03VT05]
MVDCSYLGDESGFPDKFRILQPDPGISGNGVLIGLIGTACFSVLLLVVQYLMGSSEDTNLDGFANPVDRKLLSFIWRYLGKPSGRFKEPLKNQ